MIFDKYESFNEPPPKSEGNIKLRALVAMLLVGTLIGFMLANIIFALVKHSMDCSPVDTIFV